MARIAVFGGTGYAGGHIVEAARAAGHEVVSYSRKPADAAAGGVEYRTGSLTDADTVAEAVADVDVVISSVAPRGDMAGRTASSILALAEAARLSGTRLGVIGGAGSLRVAEGGPTLLDSGFPEAFRAEAVEMSELLDALRETPDDLDWFYVSPAGGFGSFAPGEERGEYRVGGDVLLTDDKGESFISGADFGTAIVDEISRPAHRRTRFTVAY